MSRRVALLVNPRAGGGRALRAADRAATELARQGLRVDRVEGRDGAHAEALAAGAAADGVDALVVVGGDGSVHRALGALAGTGVPLGVVPAGSGDDGARALGLPRDPRAAARVVAAGGTRAVDLARAGERHFLGVLATGFDALVTARADGMRPAWGRARYPLAALAALPALRPHAYALEVDGEPLHTEALLVAVGNTPSYGGGMRICHGARLDDGLLDVVVVGPVGRAELLALLPTVYSGRHLRHPAVTVLRGATVSVSGPAVLAHADGEPLAPLPLAVTAAPAALRVLTG